MAHSILLAGFTAGLHAQGLAASAKELNREVQSLNQLINQFKVE